MKITANEEYGLRIILKVARLRKENPEALVSLNEIADSEGISSENTAAILSKLREANLIESVRGKYGGYKMAKEASEITIYQVVRALSKEPFYEDFCGSHTGIMETCVHFENCSVRPVWSNLSGLIDNFLQQVKLEQIMANEADCDVLLKGMVTSGS